MPQLSWSAAGVVAAVVFGLGSAGYTAVDKIFYQGRFVERVEGTEKRVAELGAGVAPVEYLRDHVKQIEAWEQERRTELDHMHQQDGAILQELSTAHAENAATRAAVDLAKSGFDGELKALRVDIQYIRNTLDEVRGDQRKRPQSLSGGNTGQ